MWVIRRQSDGWYYNWQGSDQSWAPNQFTSEVAQARTYTDYEKDHIHIYSDEYWEWISEEAYNLPHSD